MCHKAPPVPELYGALHEGVRVPWGTASPLALPLCSLIGASCLQRGGCERERGDDINMTSTCKGVGPLGMRSEPHLDR